jgi:hypothetical protein
MLTLLHADYNHADHINSSFTVDHVSAFEANDSRWSCSPIRQNDSLNVASSVCKALLVRLSKKQIHFADE